MKKEVMVASRKLSKLNLNAARGNINIITHWCRVAASCTDEWNYSEHTHSFFELQFCLEGKGKFLVDGNVCEIKKGEFLFLPPRKKHQIISATDDFSKFIWGFGIEDADISDILLDAASKTLISTADRRLFGAVDIILENADCDAFGSYGIIKNQLDYILKMIIRKLTPMKEKGGFSKKTSMQAEEVKKFISDNISSKMRTSDVAAQFFLSERQLEGLCKREYKMTVAELKSELRLELIRKLLAETEMTLGEIAEKCGFADQFTMSKFFKKYEENSPGRYRKASKE